MSQSLLKILADFDTQLAAPVAVGATSATLVSATDDDGVALPTGTYGFTIDNGNSSKEFFICTLTSTALTSIVSISRQGVATVGFARAHRRGAKVIVSDWAELDRIVKLLNGTTNFDSATPLGYDGTANITGANQFATKAYVDATATGGATYDQQIIAGIAGETLAAGNLVYFKEADARWWLTDADTANTVQGVLLGFAQGTATAGNAVSILRAGVEKNQSGLTPGSKYYAGNTAGAISASAGTTEVYVGNSYTATILICDFRWQDLPTALQKAALAGTSGTPGPSNKYVTDSDTSGVGAVARTSLIYGQSFGDGSDGAVVISANTSLARDMYYTNLTIDATKTLTTANYRIFVAGTLTVNGTIDNSGNAGGAGATGTTVASTGGTAGAALATGTFPAGIAGAAGGNGGAPISSASHNGGGAGGGSGSSGGILAIYANTIVIGATGVIQANGGAGGAGGAGGNGGQAPNAGGIGGNGSAGTAGNASSPSAGVSGTAHSGTNGNGGAGGQDSTTTYAGGTGGTSGAAGTATVSTTLPHSATQAIVMTDMATGTALKSSATAAGGAGGGAGGAATGANTNGSGGGGGGGYGGSGGVVVLLYNSLTNGGSITASGGAAGAAGAHGTGGISNGSDGVVGLAGTAGVIYSIAI